MEHGGLILAAEPTRLLVHVGNPVRWGAFVVAWIGAALQAAHRLARRARRLDRLVVLGLKARQEERLMAETFPDA